MILACVTNPLQPETFNFYYFDVESKTWKCLEHVNTPPQIISSLTVVGRTLYAIGGDVDWEDLLNNMETDWQKQVSCLDHKENKWKELPLMKNRHFVNAFHMVYMFGFIYIIGKSSWTSTNDFERLNVASESWESFAPIPYENGANCQSAVAVDGKILALVVYQDQNIFSSLARRDILVYDSNTDNWQTAYKQLTKSSFMPRCVLFVYKDILYRVMHIASDDGEGQIPVTSTMNVCINRDIVTVSEGDSITQDLIPANTIGAFHIHNQVFLNVHGSVIETDLKITEDQETKVDLDSWENIPLGPCEPYNPFSSNIVCFPVNNKLFV